jgi:diguanylate cyclase (GGDEF)-like protein
MTSRDIKPTNILLVDDDEDEYIITRDLFFEIGDHYVIHWFSTFAKGLEEIEKSCYDICLLDYNLGSKTGIDFINEAVTKMVNTPIILLTGQGDHEIDISAMKAGAVDYLEKKDLNSKILERTIRYVLERKKSEEKIRHLAFYDQLTDLPNRRLFLDQLQVTLASAKRYKRIFAVMFLDIDNFKRINDTLGHFIGDRLIIEVARRLFKCIRKEDIIVRDRFEKMLDTVARLGGDEFTILLSEIKEPENASKVAERVQSAFLDPVILDDIKINVTMSIGISTFPEDGDDIDTLIKNADLAMYDAKAAGRNTFQYYNLEMNHNARMKLNLENELQTALEKNEFEVYYQPLVDLKTLKIICVEALLRWNHPEKGIIPPMEFIPIAEESGLIIPIGEWILRTVCSHYTRWRKSGFTEVTVAVNISPKQLIQKRLTESIRALMQEFDIPPFKLVFEITENCIINHLKEVSSIIKNLKSLGIIFSLDDFGTGYSSFSHLKQIPFDILKIDRAYIMNVPHESGDTTIAASIIEIGQSLNLKVVAEGIEKNEQLDFLLEKNCDIGQGYYFSKPVPGESVLNLLTKGVVGKDFGV